MGLSSDDSLPMDPDGDLSEGSAVAHIPVMVNEVIQYLAPKEGDIFVDGTLGLGGHAKVVLNLIGPTGKFIGMDCDPRALSIASANLKAHEAQCHLIHANYSQMGQVLEELGIRGVDGILFDLGVSSLQLDDPERGFSFRQDGPLDMRMDYQSGRTAADLVNQLSENEISSILLLFGEERWHRRIARVIVEERSLRPIRTTAHLRDLVFRAMPHGRTRQKIHPATRTFQALRIAVNQELEGLDAVFQKGAQLLKKGGRMGVIAFHSLEDRIVKQTFRALAQSGHVSLVIKKPLRPSDHEAQQNPRARSARFRVAERI